MARRKRDAFDTATTAAIPVGLAAYYGGELGSVSMQNKANKHVNQGFAKARELESAYKANNRKYVMEKTKYENAINKAKDSLHDKTKHLKQQIIDTYHPDIKNTPEAIAKRNMLMGEMDKIKSPYDKGVANLKSRIDKIKAPEKFNQSEYINKVINRSKKMERVAGGLKNVGKVGTGLMVAGLIGGIANHYRHKARRNVR